MSFDKIGLAPKVDKLANVAPTATILGNVLLGKNVKIGPGAILRADREGAQIEIKEGSAVFERALITCLSNQVVTLEENVLVAQGAIIQGPCQIGKNCFIGFGAVVVQSEIGEGSVIKHLAVVENVNIPPKRIVESSQVLNSPGEALVLMSVDNKTTRFVEQFKNH